MLPVAPVIRLIYSHTATPMESESTPSFNIRSESPFSKVCDQILYTYLVEFVKFAIWQLFEGEESPQLFIADSYNHKIKLARELDGKKGAKVESWLEDVSEPGGEKRKLQWPP